MAQLFAESGFYQVAIVTAAASAQVFPGVSAVQKAGPVDYVTGLIGSIAECNHLPRA